MKHLKELSAGFFLFNFIGNSFGQTPENLTNFFDAGRVVQQVQEAMPSPAVSDLKPSIKTPDMHLTEMAVKIKFKFNGVIFLDNKVFSDNELRKLFEHNQGKLISLTELEKMVASVTYKYREAGYILTRAILPPQQVKHGIVKVQVIEGFISNVSVEGDYGRSKPLLESYGAHVKEIKPLQIKRLERYALLANDIPGVSVQAVLTPSKTVPAGADLTLVAKKKIGSAFVSYDNYGTRYIGPQQVNFGASLFSLLFPNDINSIRLATAARQNELRFAEFIHTQYIGTHGLRWQIGTNYAETHPDFILRPLEIKGRNNLIFTDFSFPLIRQRDKNLVIHSAFNYQNVTSTLLGQPFYQDRIRSLVLGGTFDMLDSWKGINTFGLDVTRGFSIFGAHDHVNQSRPEGHSIYVRINPSMSRLQTLSQRFSVLASVRGQYSDSALLATEQFGVGGPDIGRAYDPSEIVGDKGISGKIELRMDANPDYRILKKIQYYVFYDAGMIWNLDTINLPANQSLTSTGIGARILFLPQINGNFFVARPLTKKVSVFTALGQNETQGRIFFQIVGII